MKVLFVCNNAYNRGNGLSTSIRNTIATLRAQGVDARPMAVRNPDPDRIHLIFAVNAVRAFWLVDGEVERHFVHDVVGRMDSLYRTVPEKGGRTPGCVRGIVAQARTAVCRSARVFQYLYRQDVFLLSAHGPVRPAPDPQGLCAPLRHRPGWSRVV